LPFFYRVPPWIRGFSDTKFVRRTFQRSPVLLFAIIPTDMSFFPFPDDSAVKAAFSETLPSPTFAVEIPGTISAICVSSFQSRSIFPFAPVFFLSSGQDPLWSKSLPLIDTQELGVSKGQILGLISLPVPLLL